RQQAAGDAAIELDCTYDAAAGEGALRAASDRLCQEAEDAVRGGRVHVILTDMKSDSGRVPVPMILAAGRVHTHLVKQSLRTFTSLHVRAGECLDVHYYAVLVGVGATTV